MKILFDHPNPFLLAHGGFQIQIEETKRALEGLGIEVEFLRWWDDKQRGDMIHFFGRMPAIQIELAHQNGIKIIMCDLLSGQGSRSRGQLLGQKIATRAIQDFAPRMLSRAFNWESYRLADGLIANTPWEKHLMNYMFSAPKERIHVVPNGVEKTFFNSSPEARGEWLMCAATITERKRVVELAQAAIQARVPLWFIGKPYSNSDTYAKRFLELTRQHSQLIRYEGPVQDRAKLAQIYRKARGFVLLSSMETRSLAAEEAAACECPLLLSDLPWAHTVFGSNAEYCPIMGIDGTAAVLRKFYDAAPRIKSNFKPLSWDEVGERLKNVYETVLSTSR